jgi:hypothetical protein
MLENYLNYDNDENDKEIKQIFQNNNEKKNYVLVVNTLILRIKTK